MRHIYHEADVKVHGHLIKKEMQQQQQKKNHIYNILYSKT